MSYRQLLKTCRILVAVLLLNMVAPLVVQADDSSAYTLICTSAGLTKVSLEDFSPINDELSNATKSNVTNSLTEKLTSTDPLDSSIEHCVYCNLTDKPIYQSSAHLNYLSIEPEISVYYQTDTKRILSKSVLQYVQLRAPPLYI